MTMTKRLGAFVAEASSVTPALEHEAKRSILNFVAAALAVTSDDALGDARKILCPGDASGPASVIGHVGRIDAGSAAFLNAMAGNWLDFDDTHLETVIHPSAPVFPSALALGQKHGCSGAELLLALVLGAEVACRIGCAVSPGHYARGWHITTTCGVFGSAAAAAKILGLDAERSAHALGIAASLASGIVENLASPAKNVSVGASARNGILAARFALAGYEAADRAIEGALGWALASGDTPDLDRITGQLGEHWEFASNTYKPYPCGIVMHSVIDACLALRVDHDLRPNDIEVVRVHGDALLLARGDRAVLDARDARVSIHHAVAAPLLWGRAGLAQFLSPAVFDPSASALRERVVAVLDPTVPPGGTRVEVTTRTGETHSRTVLDAVGSVARPMTDDALVEKLHSLCQLGGGRCDPAAITAAVWALDQAPDLTPLGDAISPRGT